MMRWKRSVVLFVAFAVVLAAGCATINVPVKPWGQMSGEEKALYFLQTWNQQFADTYAMAIRPDLTDAQKEIVRKKKAILTESHGLIKIYLEFVDEGMVPSPDMEQEILNLINRLATVGG